MFSKSGAASGASLLLLSTLNQVQSLTTGTVAHAADLSCSECLRGGFEYDYTNNGMWGINGGGCYSSASGAINPVGNKSTYTSAVFTDKDYAVNACP